MKNVWNDAVSISPSLICLDMCNLEDQTRQLEESGLEMLHIDIIDGHFSPSLPLGLDTVRQLRDRTNLFFDCHVMVNDPDFFIDELIDIGVDQIIFQIETAPHIDGMLNKIKSNGIKAGVALKPSTSLKELDYILDKCDTVLLMLINPGYASSKGESQVSYAERKISELKELIDKKGLDTKIEIDGRISENDINKYGRDKVNIFVTGSTCLDKNNLSYSFKNLKNIKDSILEEING